MIIIRDWNFNIWGVGHLFNCGDRQINTKSFLSVASNYTVYSQKKLMHYPNTFKLDNVLDMFPSWASICTALTEKAKTLSEYIQTLRGFEGYFQLEKV
jgi:hypothetical protein